MTAPACSLIRIKGRPRPSDTLRRQWLAGRAHERRRSLRANDTRRRSRRGIQGGASSDSRGRAQATATNAGRCRSTVIAGRDARSSAEMTTSKTRGGAPIMDRRLQHHTCPSHEADILAAAKRLVPHVLAARDECDHLCHLSPHLADSGEGAQHSGDRGQWLPSTASPESACRHQKARKRVDRAGHLTVSVKRSFVGRLVWRSQENAEQERRGHGHNRARRSGCLQAGREARCPNDPASARPPRTRRLAAPQRNVVMGH